MNAIEIRGVSKTFGSHRAVNDLSLDVPEGSIYGFIGPNGSGKTTTIRMIMNIILPDQRRHRRARPAAVRRRARRRRLSARRARPLQEDAGPPPAALLRPAQGPDAAPSSTRSSRTGSSGSSLADVGRQAHRPAVQGHGAEGPVHRGRSSRKPKLLILDEPFSGLDPVNAEALRDAVLELRREGTTIVFSTHDMGAAERMCDRIFMIFKGNKVLDGSLDEIQARYGHDTVRVRLGAGAAALAGLAGRRDRSTTTATSRTCGSRAIRRRSCATLVAADRRSSSSRSRSRRCTTSSCASRGRRDEDLRASRARWPDEAHPDDRADRNS